MKEISQVIEQLHTINQQIIEKDNMINHMGTIIALLTRMLADTTLIRSNAYTELKTKYLDAINEQLKKIGQVSVVIEPENLEKVTKGDPNKSNVRQFTKDEVNAPIKTDIFQAPNCRRIYKSAKAIAKESVKSEDSSSASTSPDPQGAYLSFDYLGQNYYINTTPTGGTGGTGGTVYEIVDDQLRIKGNLQQATLTLLSEEANGTYQTIKIELKTSSVSVATPILFGQYTLNGM